MKPPFAYFGGKGTLAPWIVQLFPAHRVYVEPFAGSAAVLFAKSRSVHEVLNDVDGNIVHFFRVLRDRPDDLELACRATPYARDEYYACAAPAEALDDIERARRWWVLINQSFGKTAHGNTGWSVSIKRGSNEARSVWNRLGRFASIADRLAGVTIENRDALEVVQRYDDVDGVIYCDPPYLGTTRTSQRDGRRPAGDYVHEFHSDEQHRALAEALSVARATVFVSGYHSLLYDEIYAGWHSTSRRVLRRSSNGRSGANNHAVEVIWSNRPIAHQYTLEVGA